MGHTVKGKHSACILERPTVSMLPPLSSVKYSLLFKETRTGYRPQIQPGKLTSYRSNATKALLLLTTSCYAAIFDVINVNVQSVFA